MLNCSQYLVQPICLQLSEYPERNERNIGFGGVKLRMSVPIPVGNLVRLAIGHQDTMLSVVAECVWIKPASTVTYDYSGGFSFQGVSLETYQKIRNLLFELADNDLMDL
jgi:hypothetical protein